MTATARSRQGEKMSDSALSALFSGLGVGLWTTLFVCLDEANARRRAEGRRTIAESVGYRLGRLWARCKRIHH